MNKKIFKTYDIRGIYPKEINEEIFYKIGQAFVKFVKYQIACPESFATTQNKLREMSNVKGQISNVKCRVAIGRDVRDSSLSLSRAFIKGIISQGATAIDLGTVTSSMVYFSVNDDQLDGGAMITASHNPEEYNGIKLIGKNGLPISPSAIRSVMAKGSFAGPFPAFRTLVQDRLRNSVASGNLIYKDASYDYANYILSFIKPKNIKPLKIVLDASGGVAGGIATAVFSQLPCKIFKMNFWPHDKYPDHSLNPLLEESQKSISKEIKKQKADLGVIWDGDGDRAIFFDEKGRFIHPYFMTALLMKIILKKNPEVQIMHDPRLFWLIKEETEKHGGKFVLSKAGRSYFEKRMAKGDVLFAAEASGHYYFYKNFCLGDGFIPVLLILEYLSSCALKGELQKPLSSLIKPYLKKYFISGEINILLSGVHPLGCKSYRIKPELLFKKLENFYRIEPELISISHLDGLSVEYPYWHFNLRKSETEPFLRLNIEAKSKKVLEKKLKKLRKELSSFLS